MQHSAFHNFKVKSCDSTQCFEKKKNKNGNQVEIFFLPGHLFGKLPIVSDFLK
jgi:hypothetical protein